MSQKEIDKAVELLIKDFDVEEPDIKKSIKEDVKAGYSLVGAVAKFRSENRFRKRQVGQEYVGRVIGKEGKRMQDLGGGRASAVSSIAFLMKEAGVPVTREATFWGDERVDDALKMEYLKCYQFKAVKRANGNLMRVTNIKPIDDSAVMEVKELPKAGAEFAKLKDILEYVETSDLFHGYIGRFIRAKDTGDIIGFDIGDLEAGPVAVWVGGRWTVMPDDVKKVVQGLAEGQEVLVYGYVSHPEGAEPRINARGVIPFKA